MQRSIIMFESAIKSEYTKRTYEACLNRFKKHFIIKDFDSLLSIDSKKLQEMIEDYVLDHRRKNKSHGLIKTIVCSLELFFSMNDITLNWKKIKKALEVLNVWFDDRYQLDIIDWKLMTDDMKAIKKILES